MTDLIDALNDVKAALMAGAAVEAALAETAEDYGVSLTVLRNRAEKAFGDLSTLGTRAKAVQAASDAAYAEREARRKAAEEQARREAEAIAAYRATPEYQARADAAFDRMLIRTLRLLARGR